MVADSRWRSISARGVRFIELLLAPHLLAEEHTIRELEFRKKYGFTAVALLREGRSYCTDVANMKLKMGDSILMVGPHARINALQNEQNYIVLEPDLSDQPVAVRQAVTTTAIIGAAIIASIAGMYAVSKAMVETGLADLIGQQVVAIVTPLRATGAGGRFLPVDGRPDPADGRPGCRPRNRADCHQCGH